MKHSSNFKGVEYVVIGNTENINATFLYVHIKSRN